MRWCGPQRSSRLTTEVGPSGYGMRWSFSERAAGRRAVVTRFGESRLAGNGVLGQAPPDSVATGVDLWTSGAEELRAPWDGEVVGDGSRLVLRSRAGDLAVHHAVVDVDHLARGFDEPVQARRDLGLIRQRPRIGGEQVVQALLLVQRAVERPDLGVVQRQLRDLLAELVAEHRLEQDEAHEVARALAYDLAKAAYKL